MNVLQREAGSFRPPESVFPRLTPDNRPYWVAAREHRLVVPFCDGCKRAFYPIGPRCPHCFSDKISWKEPEGRPTLASWIRFHKPYFEWLKDVVPYVAGLVDVCPGVRMPVLLWPAPEADPRIGQELALAFLDVTDSLSLPVYRAIPLEGAE